MIQPDNEKFRNFRNFVIANRIKIEYKTARPDGRTKKHQTKLKNMNAKFTLKIFFKEEPKAEDADKEIAIVQNVTAEMLRKCASLLEDDNNAGVVSHNSNSGEFELTF